jgi:hypothetical protein
MDKVVVVMATSRAEETTRPAEVEKVVGTSVVVIESFHKLAKRKSVHGSTSSQRYLNYSAF